MVEIATAGAPVADAPQSYGRRVVRRFLKHRLAVVGLGFLVVLALIVVFAPFVLPYEFDQQDFNLIGEPGPMTLQHWLGTDELGRDNLTRLIYGGRVSLAVGLAGAVVSTLVGTVIGSFSGFYRGWMDVVLMRFTDIMLSIPTLPLVLLLSSLFRPSPPLLVAIVGTLIWMGTARLVRSQFLALREREFVEAARALGAGGARLMFRHILPNAVGPITVAATLAVGMAIMLESALSFLGFGIQPPVPTWGNLLNAASPWLSQAPWMAIPPGLCILCTVLSVNFLGDGLRDAMEPKE
ncbi:MAG TPA: ABC transporter permease [Devosiaceae bacterium]